MIELGVTLSNDATGDWFKIVTSFENIALDNKSSSNSISLVCVKSLAKYFTMALGSESSKPLSFFNNNEGCSIKY